MWPHAADRFKWYILIHRSWLHSGSKQHWENAKRRWLDMIKFAIANQLQSIELLRNKRSTTDLTQKKKRKKEREQRKRKILSAYIQVGSLQHRYQIKVREKLPRVIWVFNEHRILLLVFKEHARTPHDFRAQRRGYFPLNYTVCFKMQIYDIYAFTTSE